MRKARNRLFIILAILVGLLVLSACAQTEDGKQENGSQGKDEILIGFSMDTLVHERWLRDRDVFIAKANDLGAKVILQIAYSDSEEQEKQVQYLLDQNIDVLVLVPHDAVSAARMVKKAKDRGVKVISYDRLVKNADVDLYISFDNKRVGELMGEAALNMAPSGNYIFLNGSDSDNNSFMIKEGYMAALNPKILNKEINIYGETWVKDWLYENAIAYMEDVLKDDSKIAGIIAGNDTLAGAAIHVLAEKRLAGTVFVVGHDADLDGCQRVVEGTQYATVYKPINILATKGAEFAVTMAKGGLIRTDTTINDGKYEVPYYKIDPILVTKENMMETIIKDQFHRESDVYLNIENTQ